MSVQQRIQDFCRKPKKKKSIRSSFLDLPKMLTGAWGAGSATAVKQNDIHLICVNLWIKGLCLLFLWWVQTCRRLVTSLRKFFFQYKQ